jgi:hypothetical protein
LGAFGYQESLPDIDPTAGKVYQIFDDPSFFFRVAISPL